MRCFKSKLANAVRTTRAATRTEDAANLGLIWRKTHTGVKKADMLISIGVPYQCSNVTSERARQFVVSRPFPTAAKSTSEPSTRAAKWCSPSKNSASPTSATHAVRTASDLEGGRNGGFGSGPSLRHQVDCSRLVHPACCLQGLLAGLPGED
jgi:hypothetical protein